MPCFWGKELGQVTLNRVCTSRSRSLYEETAYRSIEGNKGNAIEALPSRRWSVWLPSTVANVETVL